MVNSLPWFSLSALKFPMVLLIKQMVQPAPLNLFPISVISFTKFDEMPFIMRNSVLIVFFISLLGMLMFMAQAIWS